MSAHNRSDIDPTRGPWMTTYTGRRFHPFAPLPEDVCIEDEAHALAAAPRFGGHAKTFFYSVAHHSTLVSLLCEAMAATSTPGMTEIGPIEGLAGHHHDGGEFVLLDLPRPIKHDLALAAYRELEKINLQAVKDAWGIRSVGKSPIVQAADELMLSIELRDLMEYECEDWRLRQIADGIFTLRKRVSMGTAGAQYAEQALAVIGEPGGILRHGLYGEPAQALFLARHHDLIARRDAAIVADEAFAAATDDRGRPR